MKIKIHNYPTKILPNPIFKVIEKKKNADCHGKLESAMDEIKRIYWYEKELMISIPMLYMSAATFELVESLSMLMKSTGEHIKSLEAQFPEIMQEPESKTFKSVTFKDIV